MPVIASGGQGNDFPAPSISYVAPGLTRGLAALTPHRHNPHLANMNTRPAALALAALLAFSAAEVVAQEKPAAEQRVSVLTGLAIAPDGKVVSCEVKQSSGHPALDARACETLSAKASFKSSSGSSLRQISQRLTFVLTDEPAPSPAAPQPTVAADAGQKARPSTNMSQIMRGKTDFDRAMQDPEQQAALAQYLLDLNRNGMILQYAVDRNGNLVNCEISKASVHTDMDVQASDQPPQKGQQALGKKPDKRKIVINWSDIQQSGGGPN